MFSTKLLPKFISNCEKNIFDLKLKSIAPEYNFTLISALAYLECYDFSHDWRQFDSDPSIVVFIKKSLNFNADLGYFI